MSLVRHTFSKHNKKLFSNTTQDAFSLFSPQLHLNLQSNTFAAFPNTNPHPSKPKGIGTNTEENQSYKWLRQQEKLHWRKMSAHLQLHACMSSYLTWALEQEHTLTAITRKITTHISSNYSYDQQWERYFFRPNSQNIKCQNW